MAVIVRLDNINNLLSRTGPVAEFLLTRIQTANRVAVDMVAVDTGLLKGSLQYGITEDAEGIFAYLGSALHYALPQEFGTYMMPAHPYLRPGLAAAINEL